MLALGEDVAVLVVVLLDAHCCWKFLKSVIICYA
jgi:hypothetical protein